MVVKERPAAARALAPTNGASAAATDDAGPRFLRLHDVGNVLNISESQAYALVRSGDLPAIKIGGRGQWRVEGTELERFIQRLYRDTAEFVRTHPSGAAAGEDDLDA